MKDRKKLVKEDVEMSKEEIEKALALASAKQLRAALAALSIQKAVGRLTAAGYKVSSKTDETK